MESALTDDYFLAQFLLSSGSVNESMRYLKDILSKTTNFTPEFISLFSAIYKESVAPLRNTLRRLDIEITVLQQEKKVAVLEKIQEIRDKTFAELKEKCNDAIGIIDEKLLNEVKDPPCLATLYKTKADFLRYVAEFSDEAEKNKEMSVANGDYSKAMEICKTSLTKCHPVALDVVMNFAVFMREQLRAKTQALEMLENVLREAELELGSLPETEQKEALSLLTSIRTNIGLWESDEDEN